MILFCFLFAIGGEVTLADEKGGLDAAARGMEGGGFERGERRWRPTASGPPDDSSRGPVASVRVVVTVASVRVAWGVHVLSN